MKKMNPCGRSLEPIYCFMQLILIFWDQGSDIVAVFVFFQNLDVTGIRIDSLFRSQFLGLCKCEYKYFIDQFPISTIILNSTVMRKCCFFLSPIHYCEIGEGILGGWATQSWAQDFNFFHFATSFKKYYRASSFKEPLGKSFFY